MNATAWTWAGSIVALAVIAQTIGFVGQSLASGRITFRRHSRITRATTPWRFWSWIVLAFAWCAAILCLALPLIFG